MSDIDTTRRYFSLIEVEVRSNVIVDSITEGDSMFKQKLILVSMVLLFGSFGIALTAK